MWDKRTISDGELAERVARTNARFASITVEELAEQIPARRNLWLRYMPNPPSQKELDAAIAKVVKKEFENIGKRIVNRKIYFIQAEHGAIKIGVATDPVKRLRTLQTGSPVKLTLRAVTEGGALAEEQYHYKFMAHRLHGEWFDPHPDILAEIDRLTTLPNEGKTK